MTGPRESWLVSRLDALGRHRRALVGPLLLGFLVLGVSLATLIPPFEIPDENMHWLMASSRLSFLKTPGAACVPYINLTGPFPYTPQSHVARPRDALANVLKEQPICVPRPRMYGGLLTYPGALLALTMRSGDGPADLLRALYAARILQGLLVLLALWRLAVLAGRQRSAGALAITAFMFSGLAVQESFGVTADSAQFAFATVLCSVMLAWEQLQVVDAVLFAVVGWAAMTSKPFLLPAIFPAVFVGFACAGSAPAFGVWTRLRDFLRLFHLRRRPDVAHLIVWLSALLCAASVWSSLSGFGGIPTKFDPAEQKKFLLSHPLVFLVDALLSLRPRLNELGHYMGPLGWLDAYLSQETVDAWKLLLWTAFAVELALLIPRIGRYWVRRLRSAKGREPVVPYSRPGTLTRGLSVLAVFVSVFFCLYATMLPLYLTWTPTGNHELHGFQVRYVLPNIVLLIGALFAFLSGQFPAECDPPDAAAGSSSSVEARGALMALSAVFALITVSLLGHLYWDLGLRYY